MRFVCLPMARIPWTRSVPGGQTTNLALCWLIVRFEKYKSSHASGSAKKSHHYRVPQTSIMDLGVKQSDISISIDRAGRLEKWKSHLAESERMSRGKVALVTCLQTISSIFLATLKSQCGWSEPLERPSKSLPRSQINFSIAVHDIRGSA